MRSTEIRQQRTNRLRCLVTVRADANVPMCGSTQAGTSLSECAPCPCKQFIDVSAAGERTTSPYAVQMADMIRHEHCRFKRALLVGFGISTLSSIIPQQCP